MMRTTCMYLQRVMARCERLQVYRVELRKGEWPLHAACGGPLRPRRLHRPGQRDEGGHTDRRPGSLVTFLVRLLRQAGPQAPDGRQAQFAEDQRQALHCRAHEFAGH